MRSSMRMLLLLFFGVATLQVLQLPFFPSNKQIDRYHTQLFRHLTTNFHSLVPNVVLNQTFEPDALKMDKILCPDIPKGLGPILYYDHKMLEKLVAGVRSNVAIGGASEPKDCIARQSVAVIVPFSFHNRGSKTYLTAFLHYLHHVLVKQQLDYQIFVVEQSGSELYNHGKLLNAAFVEAQRSRKDGWHCIIIHEATLLPMDSRNLYRCIENPKQLAAKVERTDNESATYYPKFGGVIALKSEHFMKVNGFSNIYWGNDPDCIDLYKRLKTAKYSIKRSKSFIGTYMILDVEPVVQGETSKTLSPYSMFEDGLSTLSYTLGIRKRMSIYTHIQVEIDETTKKVNMEMFRGILPKPVISLLNSKFDK